MRQTMVPKLAAVCAAFGMVAAANAAVVFNTNVTNNVIAGTGIGNGGFTVSTDGGIEIGLRARERYPAPNNDTNDQLGTNVYNHVTGGYTSGGALGGTRAAWNFDWSINTGTASVGGFTYQIGIDYDAGVGTNFQTFDLINDVNPNPSAGGLALWDHSFGNSGTAQSAGVEASGANLGALLLSYQALVASNSLVQNSWNMDFFENGSYPFDPNADGQYTIYLAAFRSGQEVVRSTIEVIVGNGPGTVPEPTSLALIGLALVGLASTRRRA